MRHTFVLEIDNRFKDEWEGLKKELKDTMEENARQMMEKYHI